MKFLTYFRGFSYAMIAVAMLALVLAGGLDYGLALLLAGVMIVSWFLETTRWQLPERWSFIAEVPKTSVGKFAKTKIREAYAHGDYQVIEAR